MDRHNSEGGPRETLKWVLTQRPHVMAARKIDKCLLCRAPRVNEAGLCNYCWALLRDDELKLGEAWLNGTGP